MRAIDLTTPADWTPREGEPVWVSIISADAEWESARVVRVHTRGMLKHDAINPDEVYAVCICYDSDPPGREPRYMLLPSVRPMSAVDALTMAGHVVTTRVCRDAVTRYFCGCGKEFTDPQDAAEHATRATERP